MLSPVLVSPPVELPVTLEEIASNLNLDHDDQDRFLTGLIEAAVNHLDGWGGVLGRALVSQTWEESLGRFPACSIRLRVRPVQSIVYVKYWDEENELQCLSDSWYGFYTDQNGSHITLNRGYSWPSVYERADAITVRYLAGYGSAEQVPPAVKQAILHLVAHWYQNREASVVGTSAIELPLSVSSLIAPFRFIGI